MDEPAMTKTQGSLPEQAVASGARSPARRGGQGLVLSTRVLVVGWCLWLLGSWFVLWVVAGWSMPALRSMVFSAMVGLMGIWPAVRLSQMTRRYPAVDAQGFPIAGSFKKTAHGVRGEVSASEWAAACRGTLQDWLCLNLIFQIVLWPLQLSAGWELAQVLWLDVAVAAWSLLTGLLIAWGRGTDIGTLRAWSMLLCVGLVVLEPALWWLSWPDGAAGLPAMRLSPLSAVWALSAPLSPELAMSLVKLHGVQVLSVAAAAVIGWALLGGLLMRAVWRDRET